ncbi:MAG: aminomethyl-transferring glycine dehydrogenase subunit GcvPB [Planctomycetota bacterium]
MQEEPLLLDLAGRALPTSFAGCEWEKEAGRISREVPGELLAARTPDIPHLGELDCIRHFLNLSRRNVGVDTTFYPLGSCTMKYNPKVNERIAALEGFAGLHPYEETSDTAGMTEVLSGLALALCEIAGLDAVTLAPSAGAHGELTGLFILRAALDASGRSERRVVLIPDSAHGTNPASAALAGFTPQVLRSGPDGYLRLADVQARLDASVAGMMITNPNTLGLFEREIRPIAEALHRAGGMLYMDGANMNALAGIARPGDFGVDIMHFNPHKTFGSPHGGGGPGAGPVAVRGDLAPHLPPPAFVREGSAARSLELDSRSIGRIRSFHGGIPVLLRAYAYILRLGGRGLTQAAETAVLCANYLAALLRDDYELPYPGRPMHEFVLSASVQKRAGVRALDIAKRLLDHGFHPPTVYFPLIVPEALMVEPTETESRRTLDGFAHAMREIAREARENPDLLRAAPYTTPVRCLDEVQAARRPIVTWRDREERPTL